MCGIFGYSSFNLPRDLNFIKDLLLNGLQRLEYRGYDSAGGTGCQGMSRIGLVSAIALFIQGAASGVRKG